MDETRNTHKEKKLTNWIHEITFTEGSVESLTTRDWFQYRMMMSLISNYVFTEILQSLLVCLLFLVTHRCLTFCVCVCACVTERNFIHLTSVRLYSGTTSNSLWDSDRKSPGPPNYHSPICKFPLTVVHSSIPQWHYIRQSKVGMQYSWLAGLTIAALTRPRTGIPLSH